MVNKNARAAARLARTSHVPRSPLAYRFAHLVTLAILRVVFNFEIVGRSNLPKRGSYIAVANHLNWLDAFALVLALPRDPRVHFLGWSAITKSSKLAWLIRVTKLGFVPVERDPARRALQRRRLHNRLSECLREGYVLAIFPEGQVGCAEGEMNRFMPGFARLSLTTRARIVPIALSGTRELWFRKRVRVIIGSPITPDGVRVDALVNRAHAALTALLPEYRDPGGLRLFQRRLTRLIPSLTNWTEADQ